MQANVRESEVYLLLFGFVYTYDGSKIVNEQIGSSVVVYLYDESGSPIGLRYRTSTMSESEFVSVFFEKNIFGDIIALYNINGVLIGSYTYDAWGNHTYTESGNSALTSTEVRVGRYYNPFRYRGYYYDSETGLYYLQSRNYDPAVGRFINPDRCDVITATPGQLTDKNLYAYCDNNPVMRVDGDGEFWDTVFDVVSLCISVAEVVANPADPWAWAGVVGDAIDLIPFVSGVGETTRVVKNAKRVLDNSDEVINAARKLYNASDVAGDFRKATGSYEILYKSGKTYNGKGGFKRAIQSAINHSDEPGDVVSIVWKKADTSRQAFIDEYINMCRNGGPISAGNTAEKTFNKIWGPGRKYYLEDFGKLIQ